jgi:hypothetical protein
MDVMQKNKGKWLWMDVMQDKGKGLWKDVMQDEGKGLWMDVMQKKNLGSCSKCSRPVGIAHSPHNLGA